MSDWTKDAKFEPAAVEPSVRLTDAERIAAAKTAIRRGDQDDDFWKCFPVTHGAVYFTSFCGEHSSNHDWDVLMHLARLLQVPRLSTKWIDWDAWTPKRYDRVHARYFNLKVGYPSFVGIEELRAEVEQRMTELKLEPVLVWEWMARPHPYVEDKAWRAKPFEVRMNTFRLVENFRTVAEEES